MRKNIICLVGIVLLTSCATSSYNARQFAIEEGRKADKEHYWTKYQPYVNALVTKGVIDRYSALSILGRPSESSNFSVINPFNRNIISFSYSHRECPIFDGQTVRYLELVFDNKDNLTMIGLNLPEMAIGDYLSYQLVDNRK